MPVKIEIVAETRGERREAPQRSVELLLVAEFRELLGIRALLRSHAYPFLDKALVEDDGASSISCHPMSISPIELR